MTSSVTRWVADTPEAMNAVPSEVFFLKGEWLAILDGDIIGAAWNSKGAAQAGLEVERRRRAARAK